MLTWIDESDKYLEIHKAYFDNYEIAVVRFSAGGTSAWIKNLGIVSPTIFKKSYPMGMTLEETKEQFLKEFRAYLDERVSYWMDIQYSLWYAENWVEDDE